MTKGPIAPPADARVVATQARGLLGLLVGMRVFEALHYREYRLIWFGQIFAALATWMDQVARGWLLYELTNSTLQLGLIRGGQAIPILLLSPVAGSAADRPCHFSRPGAAVIQTYSPQEFRGRTMALYHMTHVILLAGGILIGALASGVGAQWATATLSLAGALSMGGIYLALPRARLIR
jgi:hypothetical protein